MRDVLVITSSEWPVAELRALLGDDIGELLVVVPTVRQSRLQWLTNADDDAREREEDSRRERGAVAEEASRRRPDERDGRRPERDLDALRNEQGAARRPRSGAGRQGCAR